MQHYNLPHNHGQNIEKVLNKMPSEEVFTDIALAAWCSNQAVYSAIVKNASVTLRLL